MFYSFVRLLFKYIWWEVTWWDRSKKSVSKLPQLKPWCSMWITHTVGNRLPPAPLLLAADNFKSARSESKAGTRPWPCYKSLNTKIHVFGLGGLQAHGNQQELLAAGERRLLGFGELHYTLLCFWASRKRENSPTSAVAVKMIGRSWQQCQDVSKLTLPPSAFWVSWEINWYNLFVN